MAIHTKPKPDSDKPETTPELAAQTKPPQKVTPELVVAMAQSQQRFLDKAGAAQLLGVSVRSVEVWCSKRILPFSRIGRTIRFSPDDLENHVRTKLRVV